MQRITLRDSRCLAYSWFGAPRPVAHESGAGVRTPAAAAAAPRGVLVHFKGFLSSRLEAALLDDDAKNLGLSVLAVDRPGHGGSTLNPAQVPTLWGRARSIRRMLASNPQDFCP